MSPLGLEPRTHWLRVSCSSQLSYGDIYKNPDNLFSPTLAIVVVTVLYASYYLSPRIYPMHQVNSQGTTMFLPGLFWWCPGYRTPLFRPTDSGSFLDIYYDAGTIIPQGRRLTPTGLNVFLHQVGMEGLEPSRLAAPDPWSGLSTSSSTSRWSRFHFTCLWISCLPRQEG